LISFNSLALEWSFKYSGFSEIKVINLNLNNEAINFNNYGSWEDNLGNYGKGRCQRMVIIEEENNDIKFYCDCIDQDNHKIIGKGIRKSSKNAGVGNMIMSYANGT
tara:strand:- start:121 stop:438 length:318 start_codon:yes stop_codon:yes gene_type:complete